MTRLLFILTLVIGLNSCGNHASTISEKFKVDIPDTSQYSLATGEYLHKNALVDSIGLPQLELGTDDSLTIRFWYQVAVLNGGSVIILARQNGNWTATRYNYLESSEFGQHPPTYSIDSSWTQPTKPQRDISSLSAELFDLGIDNVKSQSDIESWKNDVTDGTTFNIEIANSRGYRFISHNCPDVYADSFQDCKQMAKMVEAFAATFDLEIFGGHRCRN